MRLAGKHDRLGCAVDVGTIPVGTEVVVAMSSPLMDEVRVYFPFRWWGAIVNSPVRLALYEGALAASTQISDNAPIPTGPTFGVELDPGGEILSGCRMPPPV